MGFRTRDLKTCVFTVGGLALYFVRWGTKNPENGQQIDRRNIDIATGLAQEKWDGKAISRGAHAHTRPRPRPRPTTHSGSGKQLNRHSSQTWRVVWKDLKAPEFLQTNKQVVFNLVDARGMVAKKQRWTQGGCGPDRSCGQVRSSRCSTGILFSRQSVQS